MPNKAVEPAATAGRFGHTQSWLDALLLVLVVLLCYINALQGDFQFDDYKVIVDNPNVHALDNWRALAGQGIRPLLKLSYTLNWVSGWGVVGFHAVNMLIHLGCTLLVWALARAWLGAQAGSATRHVSLFTALVFAAHPANTEAVTYICGRSTSFMALLYLAGLWTYARGRGGMTLVTPLLFGLSLAVKETAVTFPLALLLWDLSQGSKVKSALRRQWPVWALWLVCAIYFLFSESYSAHMLRSAEMNTLSGSAATQAVAFAYLLRQWFAPLWLNIDPDLAVLHHLADAWPQLILLLAALVGTAWSWRRRPWIAFGLSWALIHLVPLYIFLPRLDVANDRQLYLAGWPLALALFTELHGRVPLRPFQGIGLVIVVALAAFAIQRNQAYDNEIALWQDTVRLSPYKARVHNNLGYAYKLAGRLDDARREYNIALKLDPEHIKARYNLQRLDEP